MLVKLIFGPTVYRALRRLGGNTASNSEKSPVETLRSRLYYQSKKRGILENDILIGGFADNKLKELNESELHEYNKIINSEHNEWDLYYFMTGFYISSLFYKFIVFV